MVLLTTNACFLDMLFGQANTHRSGLNKVRRALMGLQSVMHKLPPIFYAEVLWAILDDKFRHFNECLTPSDFQGGYAVQGPMSSLRGVAATI